MPKRKLDDKAQLNIRMTEALRRKIAAEAAKSGWSINSELVRRLERSFFNQGVETLIENTALKTALALQGQGGVTLDSLQGQLDDIIIQLVKMEKRNG